MTTTEKKLSPSADDEIHLLDIAHVFAENLRLLVLLPLFIGCVALVITFFLQPVFTARTVFMPPQQQQGAAAAVMLQSLGALGGLAGAATGIKNPTDQLISLLKSETISNSLIERFKLVERYKSPFQVDARQTLLSISDIKSGKDGLITVEIDDSDPNVAANLANAYVEELESLLGTLAITEAQQRRAFFEDQLQKAKGQMVAAERALSASGVSASALKSSPAAAIGSAAQLQAQIAAQEVKVASMRGYLTESAPDFKQALTELSALRAQIGKLQRPVPDMDGDDGYISRYRDYKYNETLFELFSKQYELARVDEAREGAVIQVIDKASPPERRSSPKRAQIAVLASLASGFLILIFVFARHAIRNAAQDETTGKKWLELRKAFRKSLGLR